MSATAEITTATRVCRVCEVERPLDDFVKNGGARLHICRVCVNARKREIDQRARERGSYVGSSERQRIAEKRAMLGHKFVDESPDPQPARLLAGLMRYDRLFGLDFDTAWTEDVAFVLERVESRCATRERDEWRQAFESTERAWRSAWDRRPGPGQGLSPTLLDAVAGKRGDIERGS